MTAFRGHALRRAVNGIAWSVAALIVAAAPLTAQQVAPRPERAVLYPSLRTDLLIGRDLGAQAAVGAVLVSAYNVRLQADAGYGGVSRDVGWTQTGRIDLVTRWLSDPFRASRWGINLSGGVGLGVEERRRATAVAIVALGVEGPSDGAWVPGVEVGLGGGVRAGFTLRRPGARRR